MKITRRSMLTVGSAAIATAAASTALGGKADVKKSAASTAQSERTW